MKGQYVSFIDSDDYINACYFESMMSVLRTNNADIATCSISLVSTDRIENGSESCLTDRCLSGFEAANMMLKSEVGCATWGKLYSVDCIKDLRFVEGRIHEDFQSFSCISSC